MELRKHAIVAVLLGLHLTICSCTQTKYFDITSIIQNHFTETTLESEVLNDEDISAEVEFQIMLPKEAFITHFEMTINGTTYEGVIEEKEKAQKKFDEAKRRGETAGLVATRENAEKIFSTSVNVGANTAVTFKLIYQQLLRKIGGKYRSKIILFGDQLSEELSINIHICEPKNLVNVTVPPIRLNGDAGTIPTDAVIRVDKNTAHIAFVGNNLHLAKATSANGGVFTVEYSMEPSESPSGVIVDDGYFIYFGPDIDLTPKSVIFVLDDSGSMDGHKSRQVKQAMGNILSKLVPSDLFGIVKFSSSVRPWKPTLVEGTPEYISAAKDFVDGEDESLGTQIWKALNESLKIMDSTITKLEIVPDPSAHLIILLSDGQGTIANDQVLKNVEELGRKRFAVHTISFGEGADDDLLKALAAENHGRWKKILVDLDSALQIETYIDEIRAVDAEDIQIINYPDVVAETFPVGGVGSEIMSVGRFQKELKDYPRGPHEITLEGTKDGEPTVVTASFYLDQKDTSCGGMGINQIQNFAAKTYAMAKVEKALKDLELESDPEQKAILREKAVSVSMEYKLVTPVTSLLVVKPEQNRESSDLERAPTTTAPTTTTTSIGGRGGGGGGRWSIHSDPHFLAKLSDDVTVCFNWVGRNNEVVNLFHDVDNGIVINGLTTGEGKERTSKLYVTRLAFLLTYDDIYIEIDTEKFVFGSLRAKRNDPDRVEISLRNIDQRSYVFGIVKFHIVHARGSHVVLNIRIRKTLFKTEIRHFPSEHASKDHLDLAIPTYESQSRNLGGIFGHLQTGNIFKGGSDATIIQDESRNKTLILYNNDEFEVTQRQMRVPPLRTTVDCWFSTGHLHHLLGAKMQSFKLSSLTDIPDSI